MISRYHMASRDKTKFIEADKNDYGKDYLKITRKGNKDFKYSRIISVIQAYPDAIPTQKIITFGPY